MFIQLKLVTPERTLLDEKAVSVTIPTVEGEVTILPEHVQFTALVAAGIARMKRENGQIDEVAVSDGFMHVAKDGVVTVLTDTAERGHELNVTAIEEARERAKELMKKAAAQDDVAFAAAAAELEREMARLRLARKHQSRQKPVGSVSEQRE